VFDAKGEIYIANNGVATGQPPSQILVYPAGAHGDPSPTRAFGGSTSGLSPYGIAIGTTGTIYVTSTNYDTENRVLVYAPGARGSDAPIATIAGNNTGLHYPIGIAVDRSGTIYVANDGGGGSVTIYAAGANGNVAPTATIAGSNTSLAGTYGLAVDAWRNIYVATGLIGSEINVYGPGASGNVAPTATISGNVDDPCCVELDQSGNIYVLNAPFFFYDYASLAVFAPGTTGNATPTNVFLGPNTGLGSAFGCAVR
jgi:hypothetical protein